MILFSKWYPSFAGSEERCASMFISIFISDFLICAVKRMSKKILPSPGTLSSVFVRLTRPKLESPGSSGLVPISISSPDAGDNIPYPHVPEFLEGIFEDSCQYLFVGKQVFYVGVVFGSRRAGGLDCL